MRPTSAALSNWRAALKIRKKWEAQFDLLKSLEDFRITLEWVALASKLVADLKKAFEEREPVVCAKCLSYPTRPWTRSRSRRQLRHI